MINNSVLQEDKTTPVVDTPETEGLNSWGNSWLSFREKQTNPPWPWSFYQPLPGLGDPAGKRSVKTADANVFINPLDQTDIYKTVYPETV